MTHHESRRFGAQLGDDLPHPDEREPSAQPAQLDQQGQDQADSSFDPDYQRWRKEQMRALDEDYRHWRQDRYRKFSEEFTTWRNARLASPPAQPGRPADGADGGNDLGLANGIGVLPAGSVGSNSNK